ncbi:MAG: galactokinase [Proteobacteria bacterium]|nr:galactokinase [Pseudomonadota bacterium]
MTEPRELVAAVHARLFRRQPDFIATAPGRVNLIGEHTDYNDGFVLPVAINYYTAVAISRRKDRQICANAMNENSQVILDIDAIMEFDSAHLWSNYLRGVVSELFACGYRLTGADITIFGNVPIGAGLSSSAALEIALIRALTQLSGEPIDGLTAARIGQAAENNFVGCKCGIMDQLIAAHGEANNALLIDCRSLEFRSVLLPKDVDLLVINSNVKRQLVDGEYNLRRQQCEEVARHFSVQALRDVNLDQLSAAAADLGDDDVRRARHVITENQRTLLMAQALPAGDMSQVSELMCASHESMRRDFEITVPAIDTLVEIVRSVIGDCGGVRMTGGGFGGCVIALIPRSQATEVTAEVVARYPSLTGLQPNVFRCSASSGAFVAQDD